ncbi:MAG: dTDP-glucose 4,6-dehydratase [Pyrinomonadaceae bacterium]|nr:dTDP-glucose 4,6-dehydratase [Pyrinomonadaceae bacterium]
MSNYFITGGAGFIGSEFLRVVLRNDPDCVITNFDALTYAGRRENFEGLGFEDAGTRGHGNTGTRFFVKGDIRDSEAVMATLPDECDAIFHLAAESHVDRSIESAHDFVTTNVLGTQVLLDCAREKRVKRFVHISTDEVMGSLPEDDSTFFTEDSPFEPNSPYAASKAAAEHLVRAASETFGLDTVITRCGNNYGPRQFPEKLIPLMISNALADKPLPLYGDGLNVRDWIYVTDHCEAIWEVYKMAEPGSVYNIGARNTIRNIDVVTTILDILDKPHSLIEPVEDRLGHDRRYAIDPARIENEIGWSPKVSWEEGIRRTIDWYRQ